MTRLNHTGPSIPTMSALFDKARCEELTSYEKALCLRELEDLNGTSGAWLKFQSNERTEVFLGEASRNPEYRGKCAEEALVSAYDDLHRLIVADSMSEAAE
jgi:hypothetical protein